MRRLVLLPLVLLAWSATPAAAKIGDPDVAALQVALHERGLYAGTVDGIPGASTRRAVRKLQGVARITQDGVAGPQTRSALGPFGTPTLGSRLVSPGMSGWDVAGLQFLLAWHGFPSGSFDGVFGERTLGALLRFQHWGGIPQTGNAGPQTLAALHAAPPQSPITLRWPLPAVIGDPFGPRNNRFHAGIDIPAATGAYVRAAAPGLVVYAGWRDGGWGNLVTIEHADGVRTMYAHLSRVEVGLAQRVATGALIGRVGATGDATGPHLHLEVRLRGAAVDPLPALVG